MIDTELIKNAMGNLEEDTLTEALQAVLDEGGSAQAALEALQKGMDIVGECYENGTYFVGDLIYAGELMTNASELLRPALTAGTGTQCGRIILCTVKNDMHDIGKNIVRSILEAGGFEVLDLGVDTPPEKIVETAKAEGIRIIALSGVLTLALDSMKATVEAFTAAGMREQVKIIIGGACVSETVCDGIGADAWAYSPQKTLNICRGWAEA